MQNQIQVFSNENFGSVRVVRDSQNPLFCASDVCKALGYSSGRQTIQNLFGDDVYKLDTIDSLGRKQISTFLNEPQVYRLIMRSNAKNAEKFQDWVCGEVLPSIRKNGGYIMGQEQMSESEILAQALMVANNVIERKSKELERARMQIEIDKPKIFIYENLMDSKSNRTIQEFARDTKHIHNLLQKDIFSILNEKNFIFKNKGVWTPYASTIERGLMEIRYSTYEAKGKAFSNATAMITPKGIAYFTELLSKIKGEKK